MTFGSYPGFPGSSDGKESTHNVGNPGSIPGSGGSPGEGNGYNTTLVARSFLSVLFSQAPYNTGSPF